MPTCNILGHGIIHDTYEDQGWFDLCGWKQPNITYESFLTGITETYNTNTSLKDRVFSDYVTRLYQDCFSANTDTWVSGGTLNAVTGIATFTNTTGGTLDISGFDGFTSYWSANTDGSISVSGDSNINISGSTSYIGAISGTGSVTSIGGFVGNVTGNASTVTNGVYTTNNLSVMAATTSLQLKGVLSDETGTGSVVFATSPTLVTPALGTPDSGVLTNTTGLPIATGLAVGTSANLAGRINDETGSGALVFGTSPTLVTPVLGTPTSGTLTNCTFPTLNQNTTGTAAIATTVTLTDESSDTTCFPVFSQTATGDRALETGSNLTFNSSTGLLTSTQLSSGVITIDDKLTIDNSVIRTLGPLTIQSDLHEEYGASLIQINSPINVGVDGTGLDINIYGDTSHRQLTWDQSEDKLNVLAHLHQQYGDITFNPVNYTTTATTTLTIDNSNTTNGIEIGTNYSAVPISIGHTTSETTVNDNLTVTGTLTMGSTAAITSAGLLSVANQSNITGVGTITSGTWNAGIIAEGKLQNQSGTNTGDETLSRINALDVTELGTISSGVWEGTDVGVTHGGTGVSTLGADAVLIGAGTGAITSSTNLTFDDTDLSLAGAGKMEFRGTGSYIHSTDTNDLEIVATDMEITATNIILDAGTSIALQQDTTVTGDLTTTGNISVGNGAGLISGQTASANVFIGTKHLLRSGGIYINDDPFVQNSLYMGNSSGNQPFNWNDPQAAGGVLSDTDSVSISEDDMKWASILPFNISKIEIQCSMRTGGASTGDDFFIGLYTATRQDCAASSTMTITKVAESQDTFCQGKYVTNDFDYTGNLDEGTLIFIGIGTESDSAAKNGAGILNVTITQR